MLKYLFFAAFLLILLGIHTFVFWTLLTLILQPDALHTALVSASVIMLTVTVFILFSKRISTSLLRVTLYSTGVWIGTILCLAHSSALHQLLHLLVPVGRPAGLTIVLGVGAALTVYGLINAACTKVERVTVRLPGASSSLKIAHLSDLHLGAIYQRDFVEKIVRKVRELGPDLVVLTGDLPDGHFDITGEMLAPFCELSVPVYYVLGNHESIAGIPMVLSAVSKTGGAIRHLRNEFTVFRGFNIVGLDYVDNRGPTLQRRLSDTIPALDTTKPTILLHHVPCLTPEQLGEYAGTGGILMLAGHTHGGQMMPFQPLVWLTNACFAGLYSYRRKGVDSHVYVSTGVGAAGVPMRVFSRSVIGLITVTGLAEC